MREEGKVAYCLICLHSSYSAFTNNFFFYKVRETKGSQMLMSKQNSDFLVGDQILMRVVTINSDFSLDGLK